MNDRTMIKVRCDKELLYIRTISWQKKSPHRFAILRSELQKLEQEPNKRVLTSDCGSFASLRLTKGPDGTQILEIRFTWLQEDGNDKVHGWKEDVRIPYEPFRAFSGAGEDMDGAEWRQLSIPELVTRRYEFRCRKNLHEVTGCRLLRHKLGKILEQHFQWRGTEKIVLYDDSQPYSFFFEEYTPYGRGICGAVILHGIEDIAKALFVIILLRVWQFGSAMVIFLAALKGVSQDLYEAASIDGAGKWTQFFKITVPIITPVIFYNLITQLCQAFQEFNAPYLVTKGGPNGATTLISMLIYNNAFLRHKMGMASAQAWVLFVIVMTFTAVAFISQKKWVYYSDEDGR